MIKDLKKGVFWTVAIVGFVAFSYLSAQHIKVNVTDSLPKGIYWLSSIDNHQSLQRGDIVLFNHKSFNQSDNPDLPKIHYFLKEVAGLPGDKITKMENHISLSTIEGYSGKKITFQEQTVSGAALPVVESQTIASAHFFLWTAHQQSYDSRYYGPVPKQFIEARASLLFAF